MALSNAARQSRSRRRQQALRRQMPRPQSRAQRWLAAVTALQEVQAEYQQWLDNMPDSLLESPLGQKPEEVCGLDLESLATIELPRGWGRDCGGGMGHSGAWASPFGADGSVSGEALRLLLRQPQPPLATGSWVELYELFRFHGDGSPDQVRQQLASFLAEIPAEHLGRVLRVLEALVH